MTKIEVLKLVGTPTEIDSLGVIEKNAEVSFGKLEIWQYGDVTKPGNQRVQFIGDKVDGEVIADGLKFEELMNQFKQKKITYADYQSRLIIINKENCK
jgi:hypothetical protein